MMGGLLGSLFGGGGFHGVNFMDFLILGGLAFVLFKFLAARKSRSNRNPRLKVITSGTTNLMTRSEI